jgi:replication factor A1
MHKENTQQVDDGGIIPINQLNPYMNWTIKARCTAKSSVRTWSNAKGNGQLFNFDLVDESGEIRCTCFNEFVDEFEPVIQVGNIYLISRGIIKSGNPRFTKAQYEMSLSKGSVVQQIQESRTPIPKKRYAFVEIDRIQDLQVDGLCDVQGVITSISPVTTFLTKKDQREVKKRNIDLTDRSKRSVELTLWANMAEEFEGDIGDVVVAKNVRVNDFQGNKSLNFATNLSVLEINPPGVDGCKELKAWYNQNEDKLASEVKSISAGNWSGGATGPAPMGTYAELKADATSSKGVMLRIPSTIMWFKRDEQAPLFYKSAPGERHKVVENTQDPSNGKPWYCPGLNQYFSSYTPRFILTLSGGDFTGSEILSCFDDCGKFVVGCDAADVERLKLHDPAKLELVFAQALFQRKIFKIRAKEEYVGEEQRVKCIINGVEDIDFAKESKNLIEKIRQFQK